MVCNTILAWKLITESVPSCAFAVHISLPSGRDVEAFGTLTDRHNRLMPVRTRHWRTTAWWTLWPSGTAGRSHAGWRPGHVKYFLINNADSCGGHVGRDNRLAVWSDPDHVGAVLPGPKD